MKVKIALVGNPNCGKSTLFNALTKSKQLISNWPGVTIEKKVGFFSYKGIDFEIVDLPGVYSLSSKSIDERITRDFILNEKPDIIINIIDGTSLERSLYLTSTLIDSHSRLVIAVNMYDEVKGKGYEIDFAKMSQLLKVPVVPIIAKKRWGIVDLLDAVIRELEDSPEKRIHIYYGSDLETSISKVENKLLELFPDLRNNYFLRWISITLLSEDKTIFDFFPEGDKKRELENFVDREVNFIKGIYKEDLYEVFFEMKYGFINGLVKETFRREEKKFSKVDYTEFLDSILLNKHLGIPILFLIMFSIFHLTFSLGSVFSDYIDSGVSWLSGFINNVLPQVIFKDLLVDGIIPGVGGVLVFLPQIVILFLLISLLEDTGYVARISFLIEKFLQYFGLPGKAFLPIFVGIGCNVVGVMSSRIIESDDDRKISIFINPFMSCSARLPIYVLVTSIFFPKEGGIVIFFIYIFGILVAMLTAKLLRVFFFKNRSLSFVMELPPYRLPTLESIFLHTWNRVRDFLKKIGGIVLFASIIIWALSYYPKPREYPQAILELQKSVELEKDSEQKAKMLQELEVKMKSYEVEYSYIGRIGRFISPLFENIGFTWREGVALLTGVAAKEIVVSTLYIIYGVEEGNKDLLKERLENSGMNKFTSLGFLIFVLIYLPCISTFAAIYKETHSLRWTLFSFVYGVSLAYIFAFLLKTLSVLH